MRGQDKGLTDIDQFGSRDREEEQPKEELVRRKLKYIDTLGNKVRGKN